jgi:pSer/pThr/pTyr-binding forkhead associated (FHA) protein
MPVAAPPPAPTAPPRPAAGGMPALFVHFEGRSHIVNKDNFIIGRGTQGTDLTIRDQNVSRKHASVIFHNGAFFVQDLGSTNGVEFRGSRVESRKIEEGDVYTICDHEIVFSYRG